MKRLGQKLLHDRKLGKCDGWLHHCQSTTLIYITIPPAIIIIIIVFLFTLCSVCSRMTCTNVIQTGE